MRLVQRAGAFAIPAERLFYYNTGEPPALVRQTCRADTIDDGLVGIGGSGKIEDPVGGVGYPDAISA